MSSYTYTKEVKVDLLKKEIEDSAIVTALDYISLAGVDGLTVVFKATLSSGDQTILNDLVAAHDKDAPFALDPSKVEVVQADPDTEGLSTSPKFAPDGWYQQYHEIEFETSKLSSIHEKDIDNADLGFASIKFYDASDVELITQASIDTDCVLTVLDWMPTHDYMVLSGQIAQISVPSSDVYVWASAAPGLGGYGIPEKIFAEGGINLKFMAPQTLVGLRGVSATMMYYNVPGLGAGAGTNKLRFRVRHPAGFQHRIQCVFDLFKDGN